LNESIVSLGNSYATQLGGKANLRTILKESKVVKELENEEFEQDCEGAMRDGNAVIEVSHSLCSQVRSLLMRTHSFLALTMA
jgi:hypothetical protein